MIARVVRSGVIEAVHAGAVAAVDRTGRVIAAHGDVEARYFARSAVKPFQTLNSLRFGGPLPEEHIAVASASHGGEPVHIAIVRAILREADLDEVSLRCPPAWPLSSSAARRVSSHGQPERIWHNCSGKHAAMMRAAAAAGWPVASYTDPDHELQRANYGLISEVTEEEPGPVGVDGCGVPVFQVSTVGLARAFSRLAVEGRFGAVWTAMHRYPMLVSGIDGVDAAIGRTVNAVAKRGAEGLLAVSLAEGTGIVVKVWDGARRATGVGMISALAQLGLLGGDTANQLAALARPSVFGGGRPVGHLESTLAL